VRTPEQVVWDFVQQWLDRAEKDLKAGGVLLESGIEDFENVGFHAQQSPVNTCTSPTHRSIGPSPLNHFHCSFKR